MKNPLDSIWGTIIAGLVLIVILYFFASGFLRMPAETEFSPRALELALDRWLHILAGITWIGLLYYFNFVQVPGLGQAKADGTAAGITKHIAPRALLWFRWAAALTWVTGAYYLIRFPGHSFMDAFTLQGGSAYIGVGAWLGTIMLFNVWVLIWPNQKKVLGFVTASDEEKAKAGRVALLASRTNTMLSIPMLFFMITGTQAHGAGIFG